jgi:hypothetical protein
MRLALKVKSAADEHEMNLDLAGVVMTDEQREIVQKLAKSVRNEAIDVDADDPCEQGQCLASKHLSPDEFSKIRGLRVTLGTGVAHPHIIVDFCLHWV